MHDHELLPGLGLDHDNYRRYDGGVSCLLPPPADSCRVPVSAAKAAYTW